MMMMMMMRRLTASALVLINVLHLGALAAASSDSGSGVFDGLSHPGDFVSVRRQNGERTIAAHVGGVSAIETAAGELPHGPGGRSDDGRGSSVEPSFIYHEVTDGRQAVRAVYDGARSVRNCYLSSDRDAVLDVLEAVRDMSISRGSGGISPASSPTGTDHQPDSPTLNIVSSLESLQPYLRYSQNASDHNMALLPRPAGAHGDSSLLLPPLLRSLVSFNSTRSRCGPAWEVGPKKRRRSRRQGFFTYPKTLWCGKGTEAASYDELGEEAGTDTCCRAHDTCPHLQISPMDRKLFFRNLSPFTLSDCKCDKAFHKCLKKVGSPVAMGVGNVYFNRLKMKCFVTRKRKQCLESSMMGYCLRREKSDTAIIRDARLFPEGKNFTKAEKALRRKRRRELLQLS